jgi:integrase
MKKTAVLWTKPTKDNLHHVKIRKYQDGITSYTNLNYFVSKKDWSSAGLVKDSHPNCLEINTAILKELHPYLTTREVLRTSMRTQSDAIDTVQSVIENMMQLLKSENQIATYKKHKTALQHLTKAGLNDIPIATFSKDHKLAFTTYLTNEANVQYHGRETYTKVLKKAIRYTLEEGIRTEPSPYRTEKKTKENSNPPRYLTSGEIQTLTIRYAWECQQNSKDRHSIAQYLFAFNSYGMRCADVVSMKWSTIQNGIIRYRMSKTQKQVNIPINEFSALILIDYLQSDVTKRSNQFTALETAAIDAIKDERKSILNNLLVFSGSINIDSVEVLQEKENSLTNSLVALFPKALDLIHLMSIRLGSNLIFWPGTDEGLSPLDKYNRKGSHNSIINKVLKNVAAETNMLHFSFHSSRHSFSNNSRLNGEDVVVIMKKLGHSSLNETQKYLDKFLELPQVEDNKKYLKQFFNLMG